MFGLKTCDFPAKNVSTSKATANHTKWRRRACVCVWVCVHPGRVHMHAYVTIESSQSVKQKYTRRSQQSIISYITTLTYQMTICRPSAVRPMCCLRPECAFIYFWVSVSEHLVRIGPVPNLQRRSECLNSQWKEVGREERERRREAQRQRWMERTSEWWSRDSSHT